jgi:hypothetical protein
MISKLFKFVLNCTDLVNMLDTKSCALLTPFQWYIICIVSIHHLGIAVKSFSAHHF